MACGNAFLIGSCWLDVFGEAASSQAGVIEVDFLNGSIVRGEASENLKFAAARFAEVLPGFCRDNGAEKNRLSGSFSRVRRDYFGTTRFALNHGSEWSPLYDRICRVHSKREHQIRAGTAKLRRNLPLVMRSRPWRGRPVS
jgi:hypothetical protein